MKKILFISHKINRGGAQLLLKNLILGLDKTKFDCNVWAPLDGDLKQEYIDTGIPVYIQDFEVDRINREQNPDFNNNTRKRIEKFLNKCRKNKKKLAIRCAGTITSKLLNEFDFTGINLVGIFDNNQALIGREITGNKIYPVSDLEKFKPDYVLIAHLQPKFLEKELKSYKKISIFTTTPSQKLKEILNFIYQLRTPVSYFSRINPDIIFANNAISFWAVILGKMLGKKTIWAIHEGFDPKTFRAFPQFLYLSSFKLADKFVFPSFATYEYYRELIPQHKVHVIHNGVDTVALQEYKNADSQLNTRKELNIPQNHKIICTIGTSEEIKGHIHFVKAGINLLQKSENKDFTFILVGSKDNDYSRNLVLEIQKSDYAANFRIIPVTKDVYKYLNIADVYVTSSHSETFCIANLEAIAFNKPVIATNVGGIPETIIHNETGILIPVIEMEKYIEENIKYLVENPEIPEKLTKNAYKNLIENFTIEKMLEKYSKVFEY